MAKGQQQQGGQGGGGDNSLLPFWIILGVLGGGWLIWYNAHVYIVMLAFKIKSLEISLITTFFPIPVLNAWLGYIQHVPVETVDWPHLKKLCDAVGHYIRYPFGLILLGMATWVYTHDVSMKFRRTHSMKTLREQEQLNWPQIMPIISKNLTAEDVKLGPWAMALTPMEFSKQHNLLKKDEFAPRVASNMEVPLTATIKKGEARRILTLQLGPYWAGFDALNPYTKALAAIFIAKLNRDRDGAVKLLKILNQSSVKGQLDLTLVPSLLNKHRNSELVRDIIPKHAYVTTMMASLLEAAREDGVLATADFLWLKPVDRRLWYILNNIGRQTAFVEVAGVFAHWQVEKSLGRKCLMPMVEEAVKALEAAIKDVKLTPKEWGAIL